jgi:uncharacterized protein YjbI with pentapeptide repeats
MLAAATGYGLFVLLGSPRLPSSSSLSTSDLLDILKVGLAVVGGLGAVVALAVGYRKQQVSEAAHVLATNQEQRERTKFFNERYAKAAEQLGHESFAVRLAGAYGMMSLADDWSAQRQNCIDVLCGYLRTPYKDDVSTERELRQVIISTLLNRTWRSTWQKTVGIDFRKIEFEDLDLSGRSFNAKFNFEHAVFRGEYTNFSNSTFTGEVRFHFATFMAKYTNFSQMEARDARIEFHGATFTSRSIDFSMSRLNNSVIDLRKVDLINTNVTFQLLLSHYSEISLEGASLDQSTLDLSNLFLISSDFEYGKKSKILLDSMNINQGTLLLTGSRLENAEFSCDMTDFSDCTFENSDVNALGLKLSTNETSPAEFVRLLRIMIKR